jgi:acetyltransferase-like isoleucine patch superfamily enzyme
MNGVLRNVMSLIKWNFRVAVGGNTLALRSLGVTVGKDCRIYTRLFGGEPWLVSIGDHVAVGPHVEFMTHDGTGWLISDERGRRHHYAPISIGNNVYIGANTCILPGVKIGSNVIIGAGSLVNKSIPDNCVVTGSPAKYRISFNEFKQFALAHYRSESDMVGKTFRERVDSIVDRNPAPPIRIPQG